MKYNRSAGVLMHISSLPSPYGIGTLGKEAYRFIDFLDKSRLNIWQILPLHPIGIGNSPYSSYSSFAGNTLFIDFDILKEDGLLKESDYKCFDWGDNEEKVDFETVRANKHKVLKTAYESFKRRDLHNLLDFERQNDWLNDYALFMALKECVNKDAPWWEWEDCYKLRDQSALDKFADDNADIINYYKFTQYIFFKQWADVKSYANSKGISIIGDLAIYVVRDSVDVWVNPGDFVLDDNLVPIKVAGCPPDSFSKDGQLWGNVLYRWDKMKKEGYPFWVRRLGAASKMYNIIRIDHFRGFESFYAIDFKETTARNGKWIKGPGIDVFNAAKKKLGEIKIIAEDLGFMTKEVKALLKESGYPGMQLLEFAFDTNDKDSLLPYTYTQNSVVYLGTHDNDTVLGWLKNAKYKDSKLCKRYLRLQKKEGYNWGMIRGAYMCASDLAIIQMQDYLGLGSSARMNTPGTVGDNWVWRMKKGAADITLAKKIKKLVKLYDRSKTNI